MVLPNWTAFGWLTLAAEATIGALLIIGLWTRTAALLGFIGTIPITLSVLHLKGEWPWSYYLMLIVHVALMVSTSGRSFGIDGIRRRVDTTDWRVGARALGALAIGVGAIGFLRAPSGSFTTTHGAPIGPKSGYEFSLMTFNRAGALLVLVLGLVALGAAITNRRPLLLVSSAGFAAYCVQVLLQFRPKGGGVLGGTGSTLSFVLALSLGVVRPGRAANFLGRTEPALKMSRQGRGAARRYGRAASLQPGFCRHHDASVVKARVHQHRPEANRVVTRPCGEHGTSPIGEMRARRTASINASRQRRMCF